MKNKGIIIFLIIFMSIMAISITCLLCLLLKGNLRIGDFRFFQTESYEKIVDTSYEIRDEITIKSDASDVVIKKQEDQEIGLVVYGENERLKIFDDTNFTVDYQGKKCIGICFGDYSSRIELSLPSDFAGRITVENKYGAIKIDNFENANITSTLGFGDTTIKGGKKITVKSSAGDVEIGNVSVVNVENHFGDIEIDSIMESLEITADCGDIELGHVELTKNSSIKNSMGDIRIKRVNDIAIMAETSLGDKEIRKNNQNADVLLTIKNSMGDIEVS